MQQFVAKHAEHVIGTLSGFDRLVFRGTLRALSNRSGLMSYLWAVQVRLTEFAAHALTLTEQLKDASLSLARQIGRPVQYLTSAASNKEDIARKIAAADCIEQGLICVLTAPRVKRPGAGRRAGRLRSCATVPASGSRQSHGIASVCTSITIRSIRGSAS